MKSALLPTMRVFAALFEGRQKGSTPAASTNPHFVRPGLGDASRLRPTNSFAALGTTPAASSASKQLVLIVYRIGLFLVYLICPKLALEWSHGRTCVRDGQM
jgi:hypothetical protein